MITPSFLLTSLVVALVPGTGVVYTVSTALRGGRRAGVVASVGCTFGIVPHLAASALGLAALLHTFALAFQALKWAGALYLLYLAWGTWRETGAFELDGAAMERGSGKVALRAFALNILNPKLSLFFLAFIPQFLRPEAGSPLRQILLLSAAFMAVTFVVFVVYAFLAHLFRERVAGSPRVRTWMQRGFAAALAALGVELAVAEGR